MNFYLFIVTLAISFNFSLAWISLFENYVLYVQKNNNPDRTVYQCRAYGATFGRILTDGRLTGCIIPAQPADACSQVSRPPVFNSTTACHSPFALIIRGNCSFALKVLNGQKANYKAVIIYNDVHDPTIDVMYDDDQRSGSDVYIPSFLTNNHCGRELISKYSFQQGEYAVEIRSIWTEYDIVRYLLPFVAVVAVCFFVMLISMILKLIRDRRRLRRRRLTTQSVKKLPVKKYKKYDIPETCVICLEDFVEGEKLRVLPCNHWYHINCIDPWLTKGRKVCPVCKRRVNSENSETSESETEETSERRPLLLSNNRNIIRNYDTNTLNNTAPLMHSPISNPELEQAAGSRENPDDDITVGPMNLVRNMPITAIMEEVETLRSRGVDNEDLQVPV